VTLDKNSKPLAVGDKVRWHGRPCTVLKFDKSYPSLVEIDDPQAKQKFTGAKGGERWVRCDEVEKD
jgi:hypothetical protein